MRIVAPATLAIIFVLLYFTFRRASDALLIIATLPLALIGGLWLLYLLGYNTSIASAVGFIALLGVAAEIGVVKLIYVNQAVEARAAEGRLRSDDDLRQGIIEGAVLRVRPVAMTATVIVAGLLPIMWGSGTGAEVTRRIAAPMVGGMISVPVLSMVVLPAAYFLVRRARAARAARSAMQTHGESA
jgi:Cu(I)/Ag(I) efflux system membrane protein CusA/SilA